MVQQSSRYGVLGGCRAVGVLSHKASVDSKGDWLHW